MVVFTMDKIEYSLVQEILKDALREIKQLLEEGSSRD